MYLQPFCVLASPAFSQALRALAGEILKEAEEFACLAFLKSFLFEPEHAGKQVCSYVGTYRHVTERMAPLPGVFAHTENMRPRGRSLARNPWLPLRNHETVSQMNQKSLKGHGSQSPLVCASHFWLRSFSPALSDRLPGGWAAPSWPACERREGLWHPGLQATESIPALCCSAL